MFLFYKFSIDKERQQKQKHVNNYESIVSAIIDGQVSTTSLFFFLLKSYVVLYKEIMVFIPQT